MSSPVVYNLAATLARMRAQCKGSIYDLRNPSVEPTFPCWMFELSSEAWSRVTIDDLVNHLWCSRFDSRGNYRWPGWSHWSDSEEKPTEPPPGV